MKKKIIYAVFLILILFAAPACQKTCQFCKFVTRDSGGNIVGTPGDPTEYCGAALIAQKAIPPSPVGDNTTRVECN
jgi:hypothetical protein